MTRKPYKISPEKREAALALRGSAEYRSEAMANYDKTIARINNLFIDEPFPLPGVLEFYGLQPESTKIVHADRPLAVLDLFSGIGVFGLASRNLGLETAAFCEIDPFRQKVLQKNFPGVPIHPDITQLKAADLPPVDCVFGGFPCTDLSNANTKGRGLKGDRSGLWFEMLRLITEINPTHVVIENVPPTGNDRHWINEAQPALKDLGYTTERLNLSAAMFGGCHPRARTFLVAYSDQKRRRKLPQSNNPSFNQRISSRVFTKEDSGDNGEISWLLPNGEILRRSDGPAAWMERYFQPDKPSLDDRKRIAACGDAIYLPCAEYAIQYCIG